MLDAKTIKKIGFANGFDLVEITKLSKSQYASHVKEWVDKNRHGSMQWYEKSVDRRLDPKQHLYGKAVTAITVGLYYRPAEIDPEILADPARGIIARYALYPDYHRIMEKMLKKMASELSVLCNDNWEYRVYVDTGPLLEREVGEQGGLGFIGKNTTLINTTLGSYFFLGELVCDQNITGSDILSALHDRFAPQATAGEGTCGTCTRCQDACPTNAFVAPYTLDARKCISYLTIENRGSIPLKLRPLMKNRIYGCDICQEVCPWNKKSSGFFGNTLQKSVDQAPYLIELVNLDEDGFRKKYQGTPILRAKREGFIRNVLVAIGNWGDVSAREYVVPLLEDDSRLVREHASWALSQIDLQ